MGRVTHQMTGELCCDRSSANGMSFLGSALRGVKINESAESERKGRREERGRERVTGRSC